MEDYLFVECDFGLPSFGISGVPAASVVAHPGVWEDARHAYVHEVLIRRTGCSAALAVLFAAVMQQLLGAGRIDFAVRVDCTAAHRLPVAQVRSKPSTLNPSRVDSREMVTAAHRLTVAQVRPRP